MNKKSYSLSFFLLLILWPFLGSSATYFSRVNGNWNSPSTWSTVSCSGAASATIPGAADNVIICSGRTVTMNGAPGTCLSLTINGIASWSSVLTTNVGAGGLVLNNGSSITGTVTGSLIVSGPMTVVAGASISIGRVILNVSGLTSINGTFNDNNTGGSNTFANLDLNSTGSFSNTAAETYTITGNLNTYGGDFLATGATPIFNILGNFNVVSGICDLSRIRITVSGNTTISGTLAINSTRGTKTFNNFTVTASGFFNSTVSEAYRINGNIVVNGAFNANLGVFTLAGIGKTIAGTTAIVFDDITCTGNYTNNTSVRMMTSFRGTGTWTQGSTGTVTIETTSGSFSVSTFNASAVGNTVVYNRSGTQNVITPDDGSYSNLTVSNGSTKTLSNATILSRSLLISSGTTLATANNNLVAGGNFTNNGTFIAGTATVTLNGTIAQLMGGATTTAFNNLTITNASAIVTAATDFSVSTTFNLSAAATIFSPNATVVISGGGGTLTGNGTARVTRIATIPDFLSQYTITGKILAGLTIDYIGAGNQSVNPLNYGSLTVSTNGTRTITFPAAVVGVSNIFLPSLITTNYVIAGNTVNFNGAIAQSIPAFTYHNMISAGSSAKTLSGNIVVNNDITVTNNLDVTASNFSIAVKRNWIKIGTFNAQNGTVTFNGSVAQTLTGSGTTTFHQLDINNTSGGVLLSSGSYLLNSVISPINGNFNTGTRPFTMVSTATQTARIATKGAAASLSGNFIIQRFITARDTSYADLSSTVQASTMNDWDNELPAISYIHTPPTALASAYTYNETGDVYVPILSSSAALSPGKGFEVFLSGDYFYASLPNTTMDAVGVPNQGTQNLSSLISNNAQGWNLVGNPFASSISWASVYAASGGASSGLYDFIEMYDYTIGDWNGYTSADAIEIASGQGFWVYGLPAASPLTLIVPESAKTTASNSSIKAPIKTQPYFTLKIASQANNFSHTFKVDAKENASDEFDVADLPFRASPNKATPVLYSTINDQKVNLNTFNSANETYSMPLTIKVNAMGNYAITAAGFNFMEEYECILLEDKLLSSSALDENTFINLTSQNIYEFEMFKLEDKKRFVLHFFKNKDCKQSINSEEHIYEEHNTVEVLPYNGGNVLNFNYSENTQVLVSVFNLLGQDIVEKRNFTVEKQSEIIQLPENYRGLYFIKITSDKGNIVKKFFKR